MSRIVYQTSSLIYQNKEKKRRIKQKHTQREWEESNIEIKVYCVPLQASTNNLNANTESTRTGRSGSRNPETTQRSALRKLFWSEKLI